MTGLGCASLALTRLFRPLPRRGTMAFRHAHRLATSLRFTRRQLFPREAGSTLARTIHTVLPAHRSQEDDTSVKAAAASGMMFSGIPLLLCPGPDAVASATSTTAVSGLTAEQVATAGSATFIGAASASETSWLSPSATWWLESCVGFGDIRLGLPGLAAQVVFLAPMQAMKEIKASGSTGKLPLMPYSSMCVAGWMWGTYGLLLNNPAIWVPNVPSLVLGGYYT